MEIVIISALIIAAALLFLIELFVIPGVSIAGLAAFACLTYANYYAFAYMGVGAGIFTLVASAIVCIGMMVWFMRLKTLDKLALKKDISSTVVRDAASEIRVGDKGISITRLAQIGSADFSGKVVEVKSVDGFVSEQTPIEVKRIQDGIIMVEKQKS